MKRQVGMLLCFAVLLGILSGCGAEPSEGFSDVNGSNGDGTGIVEIGDRFFIQQCDDIYLNPDQYMNKIIKLQGLYDAWEYEGETYYLVYRRTPGCCGDDGEMGFEFTYAGEMPNPGDWIEVMGTIVMLPNDAGFENLVLQVTDLIVCETAGVDFVTQ